MKSSVKSCTPLEEVRLLRRGVDGEEGVKQGCFGPLHGVNRHSPAQSVSLRRGDGAGIRKDDKSFYLCLRNYELQKSAVSATDEIRRSSEESVPVIIRMPQNELDKHEICVQS